MTVRCSFEKVEPLAGDVLRLTLSAQGPFHFEAGQYLNVLHPHGAVIPFSIASPPGRLPELEIHFRPIAAAPEAALMRALVESGTDTEIDGPFGDVWVSELTTPLLVIAGGTGVAQANAILSHTGVSESPFEKTLVWSLASMDARYFEPCYRGATTITVTDDQRPGALTWLAEAQPDLTDTRAILCGPPGFVYAVTDALMAMGVARDQLHADAFAYAPRD